MKKYLGIILLSMALFGCQSNVISEGLSSLVAAPEIKGVALKSFSVEEQRVVFDVTLYNPNIYPLPISGLSGDIELNQIAIGSMAVNADEMIGAQETQVVTLPIQLDTKAITSAATSIFTTQQANYSFNGSIETAAGTLPISKQGKLSIGDILSVL